MKQINRMREQAFTLTDKIIQKTGPRLAGTKNSLDAAFLLKEEMAKFADKVETEDFIVHKGAFLGWIRILVIGYLFGILFLWIDHPLISAILMVVSLLILVYQFFLYKPLLDPFYPAKKGMNVVANIEPSGKVMQQVIISGHHDSARIFNFLIHQPKLYNLRVTGGISLVIAMLAISIVLIFFTTGPVVFALKIFLSAGALLTAQLWFFASGKGTPGAGDNLISSAMAVEIGRYFKENPLEHTRIILASFDAEEEGLRGARAFAKNHQKEFKETPTVLLNTDCPYFLKDLFFLTSDINCSVPLSQELSDELVKIAKEKGYSAASKPIAFLTGGTDAGELAKIGVKSTTLMAMPWSNSARSQVYHTPNDTIDHIEKDAIDAAIDIFVSYVEMHDKEITGSPI